MQPARVAAALPGHPSHAANTIIYSADAKKTLLDLVPAIKSHWDWGSQRSRKAESQPQITQITRIQLQQGRFSGLVLLA